MPGETGLDHCEVLRPNIHSPTSPGKRKPLCGGAGPVPTHPCEGRLQRGDSFGSAPGPSQMPQLGIGPQRLRGFPLEADGGILPGSLLEAGKRFVAVRWGTLILVVCYISPNVGIANTGTFSRG